MAPRYLAFAWPPSGDGSERARRLSAALARSDAWRPALRLPDLEIWIGAPATLSVRSLASGAVVVIGEIYARGVLDHPIVRGGAGANATAQDLLKDCWGNYVALLRAPEGDWRWALRDPSGALDALTWTRDGLAILSSDVADLPQGSIPAQVSLDWNAVADFLRRPASVTARPALQGLQTVTPGDLHPLGGGLGVPLWRPAHWARRSLTSQDDQGARLREAVDLAVAAAVAPSERCAVEVSGGLDSAIVATSAASGAGASKLVSTLHLEGDRPESDERRWADLVAASIGRPTAVVQLSVTPVDADDLAMFARGARPTVNAPDLSRDRGTASALARLGVDRLLTGKGGDAVFFQPPTADILADLLAARGLTALADPLVLGLARRLRRSVWSVAWEALQAGRRQASALSPLLGARARGPLTGAEHPWVEGLDVLPPAKRYQVRGVTNTQLMRGVTGYGRTVEVVHPLLSQPVLEAALSVPTWRLARDGRERGLARDLFAARVPREILTRGSKGDLSGFLARTVAANLEMLRPWLLDGCLCDADVLDRRAVEAALEPETLMRDADAPFLLKAAAIEAWVRYWQGRVPDSPDAPRRR